MAWRAVAQLIVSAGCGAILIPGLAHAQEPRPRGIDLAIGMPQQEEWPQARTMAGQPGRPIELRDILGVREISEQSISPDARMVAFVLRQAEVDSNRYRTTLWVVSTTPGSKPRLLDTDASLHGLRWMPAGRLWYQSMRDGVTEIRVISTPLSRKPVRQFHKLPAAVGALDVAPDGVTLAFVLTDSVPDRQRRQQEADGIVYGPLLSARDLIQKSWNRPPARLMLYSTRTRRLQPLWTAPATTFGGGVADVVWSPDGQRIAVSYAPSDQPHDINNVDIGVVTPKDGGFLPLVSWSGVDWRPVWSPDGSSLAFTSQGDIEGRRQELGINSLFVVAADGTQPPRLLGPAKSLNGARIIGWRADGSGLLFERGERTTSYVASARISGDSIAPVSATHYHLSQCSAVADGAAVSCVRQNATTPPEIALVDSTEPDGVRTLTHLNPAFDSIALGAVEEVRWTNRYGERANGFLIKPTDYRPGTRYPLLVMMYGFGNKFSAQAGSLSFPAQAFAGSGFAVLLMNSPAYQPFRWGGDDAAAATHADRDSPVAAIEAAVNTVVAMGVADSARCGVLGFSMGGYWTDLALTSTKLFKAASTNEAAARSPAEYYLSPAGWHFVQGSIVGGPPVGEWYARYLESAPLLRAPPQDVPILREYESLRLDALQYTMWWERGAQMELVFYPDEGHIFWQPVHRLSSMRRNLDWFRFWLLGVEDDDPARAAQYDRWRAMQRRIAQAKAEANFVGSGPRHER